MEKIFGVVVLVYVTIGLITGIIWISCIALSARKNGLDKTSQEILGLKYGTENGSTLISLFLFPSLFAVVFWPILILERIPKNNQCQNDL